MAANGFMRSVTLSEKVCVAAPNRLGERSLEANSLAVSHALQKILSLRYEQSACVSLSCSWLSSSL